MRKLHRLLRFDLHPSLHTLLYSKEQRYIFLPVFLFSLIYCIFRIIHECDSDVFEALCAELRAPVRREDDVRELAPFLCHLLQLSS